MTSYTCKRLCCAVERVTAAKSLTLNGESVTVQQLATRLELSHQAIRRRIEHRSCLIRGRQPGNRMRRIRIVGLNLCSDSDRLAAMFNSLPRSQALMATWKPRGEA